VGFKCQLYNTWVWVSNLKLYLTYKIFRVAAIDIIYEETVGTFSKHVGKSADVYTKLATILLENSHVLI
jgi:hypothetical protein